MGRHPTLMENLHGVSEGINETFAGGIRGLAWNAQPIMRGLSVPYLALGAWALADGAIVTGLALASIGAMSTRVKIPRVVTSVSSTEARQVTQMVESVPEAREDTKKYVEDLQLDQLRRHLRRNEDRPWENN